MERFDNQKLFENYIQTYGLNLFLGAGFSVMAKNKNNECLPLGNDINKKLIDFFELDKNRTFSLSQTCQKIKKNSSDALKIFLRDNYIVTEYDELYNVLSDLPIKNIITTNIDDLIEKIYCNSRTHILNDTSVSGTMIKNNSINLYKIHGSVNYPIDKNLLFTIEETNGLFLNEKNLFDAVTYKLSTAPTLYWGTSLSDGNVLHLILASNYLKNNNSQKWLIVYPSDENRKYLDDYVELGFNIILSDTKDMLKYFGTIEFAKNKKLNIGFQNYTKAFPDNYINKNLIDNSFKRPIVEFFSGAEPIISDIVSFNVIKTKYYNELLNKILEGNKTLITGIPGSGKSTILMQLAFYDDINGTKFWFDSITKEEAEKLIEIIKDEDKVYVFVDNLYNNAEAVGILCKENKIILIVAERQLNYEYVKRILNFTDNRVIDISDLNKDDVQNICKSMNKSEDEAFRFIDDMLRQPRLGQEISLFEIVYFINKSDKIINKIKSYIKELKDFVDENLKINLLDLFVFVSYTSYCGVLCSMDMLFLYYSDYKLTYKDILYAISKMNKIIVENEYDIELTNDQDYFTIRNRYFAEKSLFEIDKKVLANVLNKVFENISNELIFRYDTFKKKAYDADLTVRAFDKSEGIKFYERLLVNNKSPYIRHQYAIFLQRNKDYTLAWKQIDQAYTECNQKIFTIANTHAIITFEKNISASVTNNQIRILKETINKSFKTLEYCVGKDVRVNYHILVYARNTLKYYEKYRKDEFSSHYIKTAIEQINLLLDSPDYIYDKTKRELKDLLSKLKSIDC